MRGILFWTLVKFLFMIGIIFGFYATMFAWMWLEPSTCSVVQDRQLTDGQWVAYCVPE